MDNVLGLALRPVISCSASASRPLASSANGLMQKYSADRIQLPIILDFHSRRGREDMKAWYRQQPATRFTRVEYRKDIDGQFKHEFIVAYLDNSTVCRFDRRAREDARGHALKNEGTASEDSAHVITLADTKSRTRLDESEVLMTINLKQGQDLKFILAVCCGIQSHPGARSYSLLQYNCYFFSWTLVTTINRQGSKWQLAPGFEETWRVFSGGLVTLVQDERCGFAFETKHAPFALGSELMRHGLSALGVGLPPEFSRSSIGFNVYRCAESWIYHYIPSILSGDTLENVLFRSHLAPMLASEIHLVLRQGGQHGAEEVINEACQWEEIHHARLPKLTLGKSLWPRSLGDNVIFDEDIDFAPTGTAFWSFERRIRRKAERTSTEICDKLVASSTRFIDGTKYLSNDFPLSRATVYEECVRVFIEERMMDHCKQVESYGFGKAETLIEQAEESMAKIWVSVVGLMKDESQFSFL